MIQRLLIILVHISPHANSSSLPVKLHVLLNELLLVPRVELITWTCLLLIALKLRRLFFFLCLNPACVLRVFPLVKYFQRTFR